MLLYPFLHQLNDNLKLFLRNKFTEENIIKHINKFNKIPFGNYFMLKESELSLIYINEKTFKSFYYDRLINSNYLCSNLFYKNLKLNGNCLNRSLKLYNRWEWNWTCKSNKKKYWFK